MKRNMKETMDRLEIDEGARDLIKQMWRHGYKTSFSCEGERNFLGMKTGAYVEYEKGTGDGWFEKNAKEYGLKYDETIQFPPVGPRGKPYRVFRGRYIHSPNKIKSLEKSFSLLIFIIGLGASLIFLSPNLTSNTIANLTKQTSNLIGGVLFVTGIISGLVWFKKRER
ncbi:MAG: hypothetical protein Q8N63_04160 [Nanoarchaeota archaeon]|nr:hypothetical protein [Nanoarchaeota archaeon]